MNGTEVIIFGGLAALIIGTQMGHRRLTLRRLAIPLAAVAFVAYRYLQTVPTAGGDLDFEIILTLGGVACGLLAASLMRVERDQQTGQIVTVAGLAYAALWILVFGGRLAFAWGATHLWSHQVGLFSFQHAITGSAAWTAAFVFMALSMVITRTIIVAVRALMLTQSVSLRSLARS